MKRTLFCFFILFLIPTTIFSTGKRISINDLVANSRDPKLEYVGKGIAEMIAVELVKSRSVSRAFALRPARGGGEDIHYHARSGQERYLLAALSKEYCLVLQPHFTYFNQAGQLIPYL